MNDDGDSDSRNGDRHSIRGNEADAMSLETVAEKLDCSLSTVERLIREYNGKPPALESIKLLPGRKGCRRVTRNQLARYLLKREAEGLPFGTKRPLN